ncbi:glycosyltransferase family 2 protein [Pseudomaricurvus alcaniphilus]|uniref:glycosyltransferase family 2 protein n=1 Tax=Pseudomaricurvus alcaniphilus TaxID=1166482 RepID=UPI00140C55A9|nr:glycosyltransferase family 2 protein [Pseudomaricurvus alcaniphilus]NHN36716.1 glycosyltransferase family 2 protein [Pseudomaricurvus alcaniphilus]
MTYVVYPLLMWMAGRLSLSRAASVPAREIEYWPCVTLVIAAYNEEKVIAQKIDNSLALDYPVGKLEIMVVSDESTDQTDAIVRSYQERGVVLARQQPRRGKSAGLTNAVPAASGEILVFSDANSMYRPDAIKHLVAPFARESTGYVVGAQTYVSADDTSVSRSEQLYWNIELAMKAGESAVGSVVGGDGAIFALRKQLFEPLKDDDLSDFVTPLRIIVKGYRGVFEPKAICTEETAPDYGGEFRRKVRIVNRALRTVLRVPQALNPLRVGLFALQLFFHKVVRWFVPYLLILCLFSSLILTLAGMGWIYFLAVLAQLMGYGLAWQFSRNQQTSLPLASVCYYFCLGNIAALQGTLGVMLGKNITMWTPERG